MTPPVVTRVSIHSRRALPREDVSADFAEYVQGRLEGPVLRYSARLALVKEAERRGLGRFEANLVIAAVLYRRGMGQEYELRPKAEWVWPVMTAVVLQGAIVAGAWWVMG
jgi:hypothetical protein